MGENLVYIIFAWFPFMVFDRILFIRIKVTKFTLLAKNLLLVQCLTSSPFKIDFCVYKFHSNWYFEIFCISIKFKFLKNFVVLNLNIIQNLKNFLVWATVILSLSYLVRWACTKCGVFVSGDDLIFSKS